MVESLGMKQGRLVFASTILLYAFLWFAPDKKIAFLVIGIYLFALMRILNSVHVTLMVALAGLAPLTFGKLFPVELVSATDLRIVGRPLGISADIVITIREAIVGIMALSLVADVLRGRITWYPKTRIGIILFAIPLGLVLSTIAGSILPYVSFAHSFFWWEAYTVYRYIISYDKTIDIRIILGAVAASLFAESLITLVQAITGGPLGLSIEYVPDSIPVDVTPDVGGSAFRFGGTFAYANVLANYLICVIPILLPILYDRTNNLRVPTLYALVLGISALVVTLSRSAWAGGAIGSFLAIYLLERTFGFRIHPIRIPKSMLISVMCAGLLLLFIVLPRLMGTTNSFEKYGSIQTRELLLESAWKTVRQHPMFGVGLELWAYDSYLLTRGTGAASVFSYFPEPVHNGFMKILVESGLIVLIPYLFYWIIVIPSLWKRIQRKGVFRLYGIGLLSGSIGVLINAQMQPLLPDLPLITLFYGLLVEKHRDTIKNVHE